LFPFFASFFPPANFLGSYVIASLQFSLRILEELLFRWCLLQPSLFPSLSCVFTFDDRHCKIPYKMLHEAGTSLVPRVGPLTSLSGRSPLKNVRQLPVSPSLTFGCWDGSIPFCPDYPPPCDLDGFDVLRVPVLICCSSKSPPLALSLAASGSILPPIPCLKATARLWRSILFRLFSTTTGRPEFESRLEAFMRSFTSSFPFPFCPRRSFPTSFFFLGTPLSVAV